MLASAAAGGGVHSKPYSSTYKVKTWAVLNQKWEQRQGFELRPRYDSYCEWVGNFCVNCMRVWLWLANEVDTQM